MVKWDPPLSEPAVGAGVGWRNQSEELVFISCLISCRLSSAFRSILSLPGFSGGGGSARGIKIYSLTPSSLVRGGGQRQEELLPLLRLCVCGVFCGGVEEVYDTTEHGEAEDPGMPERGPELKLVSGKETWK